LYSLFINVLHAKGRFSKEYFYNLKKSVMKVEKFKVLLYLKKSEPDKTGKAPIMGRITLNRTMAQFSCKLSCTPGLWNARESRLNGKSREAVETNEKIERLLLAVHSAFNSLMERKKDFDAAAVRDMFQGNAGMQMTLLKLLDRHNEEMKAVWAWTVRRRQCRPTSTPGAPLPNSSKRNSRSRTLPSDSSTSSSSVTTRISAWKRRDWRWRRCAITCPS